MESIGERLEHARRQRLLTQIELAEQAHVNVATISRIENQSVVSLPRMTTTRRLARALGISPQWLAYGTGEMELGDEMVKVAA